MNIIQRAIAPTPQFFKILRNIGLVLLAVSGTIMASPIALPTLIVSVAGYAAVAGGVISAVSQVTVNERTKKGNETKNAYDAEGNQDGYDQDIYRE